MKTQLGVTAFSCTPQSHIRERFWLNSSDLTRKPPGPSLTLRGHGRGQVQCTVPASRQLGGDSYNWVVQPSGLRILK